MKRDMDLIRALLLHLESLEGSPGTNFFLDGRNPDMQIAGWDADAVNHHLNMLRDGGLIVCPGSQPAEAGVIFTDLTWEGRDFLDTVRDPEVWKRTKEGASKLGGAAFSLIKDMAIAYGKHVAKERLGIEL